jgi:hypothetical protein
VIQATMSQHEAMHGSAGLCPELSALCKVKKRGKEEQK